MAQDCPRHCSAAILLSYAEVSLGREILPAMSLPFPFLAAALLAAPLAAQGPASPDGFHPLASIGVPNGTAEIVAATGDGMTLAYTNSATGSLGIVDIGNPAAPVVVAEVPLPGEPTSVAIHGTTAVVAVWVDKPSEGAPPPAFLPGSLYVVDLAIPSAPVLVGSVDIGWQPDSVKLVERNGALIAIVAIENQPVVVENGLVTDEEAPGSPNDVSPAGLIQFIRLDPQVPSNSVVTDLYLPAATMALAGALYPADPQPEYVALHGDLAAVTLQENDSVAMIDFSAPGAPLLLDVFSTGIVSSRNADLLEDDAISLTEDYPGLIGPVYDPPEDAGGALLPGGLRMPDALAFSADGSVLFTADEGELNYTGGRGFSAWGANGAFLWDDAGLVERLAVRAGQYPEGRSENKGAEMEGVAAATFGARDFAFVLSERGSFMVVADVSVPAAPRILQLLPTGISPEGVEPIPARDLVVTADEVSGTLSIFQAYYGARPLTPAQPVLFSAGADEPWAALSGLVSMPHGRALLAVPDNALQTSVFRIDLGGRAARVSKLGDVTVQGAQARYDGEGIELDRSIMAPAMPGVWIASEGDGNMLPNLLVQVDGSGAVVREIQLPFAVDAGADPALPGNAQPGAGGQKIRNNGFEGVCLSDDGRYLLAAIQRDFKNEFGSPKYARIARYDLDQLVQNPGLQVGLRAGGDWDFFFYPLDSDDADNWAGISEVVNLGGDRFAVIERDKGVANGSALKKIYEFSLAGLAGDADGLPDAADTVAKLLLADVLADFFPYEKIEGLAPTPQGELWIGLDNDGGEVENRLLNLGQIY